MENKELVTRLRDCGTYGFKQEICREAADALAAKDAEIERLKADCMKASIAAGNGQMEINRLKSENERIRQNSVSMEVYKMVCAERDAAVDDMHNDDACAVCIGAVVEVDGCEMDCLDCKLECRCKECRDESKWQWRGASEAAL